MSLDAPIDGTRNGKAGDMSEDKEMLLSDLVQCKERQPSDQVELSLLRQCLENAMSSELSPHERDILRLRLGLDDGVTRTVREVREVCGGTVSIAEIRSTEKRAYQKMRSPHSVHSSQLAAFLDFAEVDRSTITNVSIPNRRRDGQPRRRRMLREPPLKKKE